MKFETGNLKKGILISLIGLNAFGFEATMSIQPPLVDLNESAALTIQVRDAKNPQPPVLPKVPGIQINYAGQSTQHTWVNGKSDSFTAFNFTIYPQQTGTFTIGPFDYTVGRKTKTLQGELKVVGTSGEAQHSQSLSDLLFAKMTSNRESAYVQEPFNLTLSIYSRQGVQLAGNLNLSGMPTSGLPDLQWQEVQPRKREVVNNVLYDVRRFQTRTRAMSSGRFEFKPSVTVQVATQSQPRQRDPFFGSMFQRTQTRPVNVPVKQVTVEVKPLPETGKPTNFKGAVGQFNFETGAKPLEVQAGDPVTLQLLITGTGNFDRVMMPDLPADNSFRLFGDPIRKQTDQGVLFEQVISPRNATVHEIPAILFSFFDTDSGNYRAVKSAPIPILVNASSNNTAQVFAAKDSIVLPPQETPFATESDVQRIESALQSFWQTIRPWLWTLPAALLAGLMVFFGRKLRHTRKHDTARIRRQKAPKAALKALKKADRAQQNGDVKLFHDALWQTLTDYFGHRLNLPPGDVTSTIALQALERKAFDPEQLNTLRSIFEQLESSRYGLPAETNSEEMLRLRNRLQQLLKHCEKVKM